MQLRDSLITAVCRLLSVPFSVFAPAFPAARAVSSIVVVKPCCIGDVTLATAALAALRRAYPEARIAFVVSAWAREAIAHNPRLDEIVDCGNVGGGRGYDRRELLSLVGRIRKGKFDLAVVLERSPLLSLIPFLAGVRHRAGIDSAGRGFSLTVKAPWQETKHEAELYLDVVRALGIDTGNTAAEFYPSPDDSEKAVAIISSALGDKGPANSRLALIHPGGAANPGMVLSAKRWLPERYAEIAVRLIDAGWTVLVAGAESDRPAAETLMAALDNPGLRGRGTVLPRKDAPTNDLCCTPTDDPIQAKNRHGAKVADLVGKMSLGEFAAVAQRCQVFIGNDTGPMHIASAVGTPTVAVFGPSTPEMYAPFGPKVAVVYNKVECSPCFVKGRFDESCRNYKCMQAVSVDAVWQAISQVLGE